MKPKAYRPSWTIKPKTSTLPLLFLSSAFFFLAGLFLSSLLSDEIYSSAKSTQIKSVNDVVDYTLLQHGETGDDSLTVIPFQVLSWKPRALYYPKFASREQCESIINMAKPKLLPSTVALRKGETEENTKGIRTSTGMFLSASDDPSGVLDAIEEKIARATLIPRNFGEEFNVLRYEIGEKYDSHYDAFNPAEYGPQKSHRVASFLLYLSDVEEGGETMFPYENEADLDENYDFLKCLGLKVKPRKGDGLLFYSLFPNSTIDPTSLHGSCPVIKGEKWVATKWIRDQIQEQDD